MSKRKNDESGRVKPAGEPRTDADSDGNADMDDNGDIQVAFEWCNFEPQVDFLGLKNLLREQFDVDHDLIDISGLADLILSQGEIGTTVKCGAENDSSEEIHASDPYAYMTVLNLHSLRDNAVVKQLREYLISRFATNPRLARAAEILDPGSTSRPGLILTHRVQNMPHAVAPPLFRMQADETAALAATDASYKFTHYLIHTRCYTQVASTLSDARETSRPRKKTKAGPVAAAQSEGDGDGEGEGESRGDRVLQYNVENEILHGHAACFGEFEYVKQQSQGPSDAKRAFGEFGTRNHGHAILLEAAGLTDGIAALEREMGSAT